MSSENEFTVSVHPTTDLGATLEQPTGRKSLSVTHRPGLLPQSTLDWAGPGQAAETYGRGPAERPLSEPPDDGISGSGRDA
ncbi:hypothetical protein [Flindersiella endophytica]